MNPIVKAIHNRISFSPKYLVAPGPDGRELEILADAAGAAPDHGALGPARIVLVTEGARASLAEAFAAATIEFKPDAAPAELADSRERAMGGPVLLALIARIDSDHARVPGTEQWISVGAFVQNLLLAAESLGYRGKLLSGERVRSRALRQYFSLGKDEHLAAFVALGRPVGEPKVRPRRRASEILSRK